MKLFNLHGHIKVYTKLKIAIAQIHNVILYNFKYQY